MSTREEKERLALLQGTLDLLILRTLLFGRKHGQGIARAIQEWSREELLVEHGALYPALRRLEERGWIAAKWGSSANKRKARFYSLTTTGRQQLVNETTVEPIGGGHPAEFLVNQRKQLLSGLRVALRCGVEDVSDIAHD